MSSEPEDLKFLGPELTLKLEQLRRRRLTVFEVQERGHFMKHEPGKSTAPCFGYCIYTYDFEHPNTLSSRHARATSPLSWVCEDDDCEMICTLHPDRTIEAHCSKCDIPSFYSRQGVKTSAEEGSL